MKYISLNWTLALKFSIGKKKNMRDCRILMAYDCTLGLCIFDLFSPQNFNLSGKDELLYKNKEANNFLDYFKKSPRTNQKIY